MTNNPKPKLPIQVIFAILLLVATLTVGFVVLLVIFKPAITTLQLPNLISPTQTLSKTPVALTDTASPTWTSTIIPTNTSTPTVAPSLIPTYTPIAKPLPDLTVTGISDPVCLRDGRSGSVTLTIVVRNIGRGATRSFGRFDVRINLILGQKHYGLDEWASRFNGVIGSSNPEIVNLNPNADVELKIALDLKGSSIFGIEAIANSGTNSIPESDTTNNTLIKYYSVYCY
ncbi:MAG: hypothetical protein ABI904_06015 [Chloroflexota bacterium]